jgi:inosine-uridine nucleoside N-ribohydrolase
MMKQQEKWIFDNDGGLDDTYALVLLLSKPELIRLECITIVGGNVPVDIAAKANIRTLEICQAKVPVYLGANEGIVQPQNFIFQIHGRDGQGDALDYKDLVGYVDCVRIDMHAVEAIIRTINNNVGNISILATGPLTNIALALKLNPDIAKKINRFVVMGGSHYSMGNSSWGAEFNFHCDPEAAEICIRNFPSIELLTLENGNDFIVTPEDMHKWLNPETVRGKFLHSISQIILKNPMYNRVYCYDALAAAMVINPEVIKKAIKARCKVELLGTETRGALLINWKNIKDYKGKDVLPLIVLEVNYKMVMDLLISSTNS